MNIRCAKPLGYSVYYFEAKVMVTKKKLAETRAKL